MLSGVRTVIVDQDMLTLRASPNDQASERAVLEAGVVARLGTCTSGWCQLTAGGYRGWAPQDVLWGTMPGEERD